MIRVPRVGDLIDLRFAGDDVLTFHGHRVADVTWSDDAVTVQCECEVAP